MKLRIKGSSIRLRLSQNDVKTIANDGLVKEHTEFGTSTFTYLMEVINDTEIQVGFNMGTIRIGVPEKIIQKWANSEQEGFEATVPTESGEIYLLVQKDFQCLTPRREDESDLYINPKNLDC